MIQKIKAFFNRLNVFKVMSVGESISNFLDIRYGDISTIESVNWLHYSTCRGSMSKQKLITIIEIILDDGYLYTEDQKDHAVYDGLFDWLCHQYTFYSVTPLFLHYLIRNYPLAAQSNEDLKNFVDVCKNQGSKAICLTNGERIRNRLGVLPIYRIEDVFRASSDVYFHDTSRS